MSGGITISIIKLAITIMVCGLILAAGTASAEGSWSYENPGGMPWQGQETGGNMMLQVMSSAEYGSAPQQQVPGYGGYQPYGEVQSSVSEQQVPGYGGYQPYGEVQSSASEQQVAGMGGWPHKDKKHHNYDWLSPGGVASVRYYDWRYPKTTYYTTWYPTTYYTTWYYPTKTYYYDWYSPVLYNSWDPWWATTVYGGHATYYWSSSWSW